jgi:hypothetical protein
MLASQYRMWRLEQMANNIESHRRVAQFLMELPLPRMLASHVDIVLMNRLIGSFFDIELPTYKSHHAFHLIDWSNDVDAMNARLLKYMASKSYTFDEWVSQIPVAFTEDLHDHLLLPELDFMRPVQWAAVVARLALVTFLVQFNYKFGTGANQMYLNYLRRYILQMDVGRMLESGLSRERYEDVRTLIELGIEPYL